MKRTTVTALTLVIGLAAVVAPVLIAIHASRQQALDTETERALSYARDVMHRSDATADQVARGIARLRAMHQADPCSAASIAEMRRIDVSSSYIQTIGRVVGDRLVCSSMGTHVPALRLGPVELTTSRRTRLRSNVELPFAPGTRFIVIERDGYAAVIHKDLPIDVATPGADVALATFALDGRRVLTSRGRVDPAWIARLGKANQATFNDGGHVVAVVKSRRYLTGTLAALPAAGLDAQVRAFARTLVPIGGLAGLVLAMVILYLARQRVAMPSVLRSALRRNEFFLVYQPIVELRTGRWIGAEALIRWRRPDGEMVRPDAFIPVAEDTGLIARITERVMELVAADVGTLFRDHPHFHIAINLAASDLKSPRTGDLLRRLARRTGAGPRNLIVEATERGFLHAHIASELIRSLRSDGICVAIDDFGTGYSSLSYLEAFELDFLKIDKAFVDTLGTEAPTSHVVVHIIRMAKDLRLHVIAEGVETEAQAQSLRDQGVEFAQGWLFARPMPLVELVAQLPARSEPAPGTAPRPAEVPTA